MVNYGNEVTRVLPTEDTSYVGVIHQKLRPAMDAENNLAHDLSDFNSRARHRSLLYSGVTNLKAANQPKIFVTTLDPDFVGNFGKFPNEFAIQNFDAVVNGWQIKVRNSRVLGGNYDDPDYCSIELEDGPAFTGSTQTDFIFLEVWRSVIRPRPNADYKPEPTRVYRHGNTQYADLGGNLSDDLLDPTLQAQTSMRVQVQYRLRVVQNPNFTLYADGLGDPNIRAQGNSNTVTSYAYVQSPDDPGLYIAGDGSTGAQSEMQNPDGYCYAIPITKIHRRNQAPYSYTNNQNGSATSINDTLSDRPDGLFRDEISERDIVDLRHIVLTNKSFSEILEESFDSLLRRDLRTEFGRDSEIGNSNAGTEMLTVDGYATVDVPGVFEMPFDPDGIRRDYSGFPRQHSVSIQVNTAADFNNGTIVYNSISSVLTINIGSTNTIVSDPIIFDATGVAISPQPSWTTPTTGTKITTVPGAVLGQTITLTFDVIYSPLGHRFIAQDYFDVYNDRPGNPQRWAFTVDSTAFTQRRQVIREGLPVTLGISDAIYDYPVVTLNTNGTVNYPTVELGDLTSRMAYTQVYEYHMQGNGTNIFVLPKTIDGVEVLGVLRVDIAATPIVSFTQVDPTLVQEVLPSNIQVTLPTSVPNTDLVKFSLVMDKTGVVLDKTTLGIREIMGMQKLTTTATGTNVLNFSLTRTPYALASYLDSGNVLNFYAYIGGTRTDVTSMTFTANGVSLTFDNPITTGTSCNVYVLSAYAPDSLDRVQIFYNRIPYQGLSDASILDNAEILAVGVKPLLHSIGASADTVFRNKEMYAISEILPLAFGYFDTDLSNESLNLQNTQFTDFRMLRVPGIYHDYRSGSIGKAPEVGGVITLDTVSNTPSRGVANRSLNLENTLSLTEYPIEYITPKLVGSANHQYVTYYLVQSQSKELFLLVITYISNSDGSQRVVSNSEELGVAYDVFRIKGRPLLRK